MRQSRIVPHPAFRTDSYRPLHERTPILLFCLSLLIGLSAACAPTLEPTPQDFSAAALPPEATSIPVLTPTPQLDLPQTGLPTAASSAAQETPEVLPRLTTDEPLLFFELSMFNADVGWAVTAEERSDRYYRSYRLLRTVDGGHSWWEVTPPELIDPSDVDSLMLFYFFMDQDRAWVTPHSVSSHKRPFVWRTDDGGQTWAASTLRTRGAAVHAAPWIEFTDPKNGWLLWDYFTGASSHEGDLFRSHDGGVTWESVLFESFPFSVIRDIDFLDNYTGWLLSGHGAGFVPPYYMKITNDGGLSWKVVNPDPEYGPSPLPGDCSMLDPQIHSYSEGRVIRRCQTYREDLPGILHYLGTTSDSGHNWVYTELPGQPFSLGTTNGWAVAGLDWAAERAGEPAVIYKTADGGLNWREIAQVPWRGDLFFATAQHGWAIVDGELLRTVDGGGTWEPIGAELVDAPAMPLDSTRWAQIVKPYEAITPAKSAQIALIGEFSAPSPVSMAMNNRALYVGLENGRVAVWGGALRTPRDLPRLRLGESWIYDLETNPDYPGFYAASQDGNIYNYGDYSFDLLTAWPGFHGEVSGVALHPDALLSCGEDGLIRARPYYTDSDDEPKLDYELQGHNGWVWDVDFSRDSDIIASGSADATVRLWQAENGQLLHVLRGHDSAVTKVRFSPSGKTLASASRDGTVRIWDVYIGEEIAVLSGHRDWVLDLAFSPNSDLLASVDADGELMLWDAHSSELLRSWTAHDGAARGVVFRPDGLMLITAGDDDAVRVWGIDD